VGVVGVDHARTATQIRILNLLTSQFLWLFSCGHSGATRKFREEAQVLAVFDRVIQTNINLYKSTETPRDGNQEI
jgi:hypothetical protein